MLSQAHPLSRKYISHLIQLKGVYVSTVAGELQDVKKQCQCLVLQNVPQVLAKVSNGLWLKETAIVEQ